MRLIETRSLPSNPIRSYPTDLDDSRVYILQDNITVPDNFIYVPDP